MNNGRLLAIGMIVATIVFIVYGTLFPLPSASAFGGATSRLRSSATAQAAVENLGDEIRGREIKTAYESLANKAQFTQTQFQHDLVGAYPNLLSYASLTNYEVRPLHATEDTADIRLVLNWATVVGAAVTTRDLHLEKDGDHWVANWPITPEPTLPPQVIPVNYLRWDVIYRGAGDDWGSQDVDAPHIKLIDMHPVERAEGVVVLGELLNEDVFPAYVSVKATLLSKENTPIETEGSFDRISHVLLPKQVTPFLIRFPKVSMADVGSIRMDPSSALISASADPVIEIANESLHPSPDASLTGQLINQSGQVVNVAHVLATFYDKSGQVVWVADQYVDQALLPQTPAPFLIHIPEDLSKTINSQRTVIATYISGGNS